MAKSALSAILLIVFLLCSVWLIQQQGQSYRDDLAQAGRSALYARAINPVERPRDEPSPAEASARAPEQIRKADPVADNRHTPETPTIESPPPPPAPVTEPEKPEPVQAARPVEKAKQAPRADPPKQRTRITVEIGKDPVNLTIDEERQIGRALNQIILERHPQANDGALLRRVSEAARPIQRLCNRKEIDYEFFILDSSAVNAFSHLGGYIYLNRGLFDLLADDIELQFVLAHEIAHVDQRDDIQQLSQQLRDQHAQPAKPGPGPGPDPLQRLYHNIATGHTDAPEFEADAWAYRQLTHLGHTRREALSFPLRFREFVETHGLARGRRPPKTGLERDVQDVNNHWYALPSAMDRLDRLERLAGGKDADTP